MSMIACPECNNEISDKAEKCPHCGYPLRKANAEPYDKVNIDGSKLTKNGKISSITLPAAFFVLAFIFTFISNIAAAALCLFAILFSAVALTEAPKKKSGLVLILSFSLIFLLGNAASCATKIAKSPDTANSANNKTVNAVNSTEPRQKETEAQSTAASETEVTTETEATTATEKVLTAGENYDNNGLKITFNQVNLNYQSDNQYIVPADGNKFIEINLTYENTADSGTKYASIYDFDCYADNSACEPKYLGDSNFINTNLSPGRNVTFNIYFEVPKTAASIEVEYKENSIWSDKRVKFKLQ